MGLLYGLQVTVMLHWHTLRDHSLSPPTQLLENANKTFWYVFFFFFSFLLLIAPFVIDKKTNRGPNDADASFGPLASFFPFFWYFINANYCILGVDKL